MARCANMLCAAGISQEYLLFYVTGKSRHARDFLLGLLRYHVSFCQSWAAAAVRLTV